MSPQPPINVQNMKYANNTTEPVWYQPIVDTYESRVLGHECHPSGRIGRINGLCFVDHTASEAALESGIPAENIVIEMAEGDLAREPEHLVRIYDAHREKGFGAALTGAGVNGTGSLELIRQLRPDYIKLDERLTRRIQQPACAAMIAKIAELADRWGLRVIAENVDRKSVVEDLWLLGIQFMQGSLFGDPAPWPVSLRPSSLQCSRSGHYTRICHSDGTPPFLTSKA
jgi:EAL domain-containing protein (putative c-di-GMP-specific phosphodiesterase class I)